MRNHLSTRANIIATLARIQAGASLTTEQEWLFSTINPNDRAFAHALLLGTLRQWFALLRLTQSMADKPITEATVLAALQVGMYQLIYLNTPDHAAISATVDAIKQLEQEKAAGLVNAILRRIQQDLQKNRQKLEKKLNKNHSLPNWLAKALKQDWREQYDVLTQHLRQPAPIFLRVNPNQTTVDDYLALLKHVDIAAKSVHLQHVNQWCIQLLSPCRIATLPHFSDGYVSVQDMNAQRSVLLFNELNNNTVLDACAAPGGKTAQLLEMFHMEQLVVMDVDENRLARVRENLNRLQLTDNPINYVCADATVWQSKQRFDAILLDAPCTATGVIRRHPDISLLRQETDVKQTIDLQAKILDNLWHKLKVGGELVYTTCSLLKAENEQQMAAFLARTPNAKEIKITTDWGVECPIGKQCLPLTLDDGDGFYFAKLVKIA